MRGRARRGRAALLFPLLAAGLFAADQYAKQRARGLREGEIQKSRRGLVLFRNSRNSGAAMNLGERHPAVVGAAAIFLTAALTPVFIITLGKAGRYALKTGLALLLGGAWSNAYDRLRRGYVTDFVSFDIGVPELRSIVFNFADFGIALGAAVMALRALS